MQVCLGRVDNGGGVGSGDRCERMAKQGSLWTPQSFWQPLQRAEAVVIHAAVDFETKLRAYDWRGRLPGLQMQAICAGTTSDLRTPIGLCTCTPFLTFYALVFYAVNGWLVGCGAEGFAWLESSHGVP